MFTGCILLRQFWHWNIYTVMAYVIEISNQTSKSNLEWIWLALKNTKHSNIFNINIKLEFIFKNWTQSFVVLLVCKSVDRRTFIWSMTFKNSFQKRAWLNDRALQWLMNFQFQSHISTFRPIPWDFLHEMKLTYNVIIAKWI